MQASKDERQARADFAQRYAVAPSAVLDEVEQRVIGAVWGANGYTTLAQADLLGDLLALAPGMRLLDIGSGRGWPGLYLARRSGCDVVLTDLPLEGLVLALRRADAERVDAAALVSSGVRLPFKHASFDAIVHTDVLC